MLFIYDWDWAGAERAFRRALQIDPRYATAHQWYAWLLLVRGRASESLAEGHAAVDLDPASVSIRRSLGWLYYHARRYDAAVRHLLRACAMDPTAAENHRILGVVYAVRGESAHAEAACREAVRLSAGGPVAVGALSFALTGAGRADEARALAAELEARAAREYVSPVALGTAYLGLGMFDAVLDQLERAYRERRGWVAYLDAEQMFDPLRGMPRFEELRRRMGFAAA